MALPNLGSAPQCGVSCLVDSLSVSSCGAGNTNISCLCADFLIQTVTSCVKSNCSVRDSLSLKNLTSVLCDDPGTDNSSFLIGLQTFLLVIVVVAFALRMVCRALRIAPWGHDDSTIVVAFMFTIVFQGLGYQEIGNGLGRDVWFLTPQGLDQYLKTFYVEEVVYSFVLATVKISICFLYIRLFPGSTFRRVCWTTQALQILMLAVFVAFDFAICRPLSAFWTSWDHERTGHCWNNNAFVWSHAAINIAQDIWLLVLPASQVWNLNMKWRHKLRVLSMFALGIFLTIASIVRLQSLSRFDLTTSGNPTQDFVGVGVWSSIEITIGVVVACMPAGQMVIMHYLNILKTRYFSAETEWSAIPGAGGPSSGSWIANLEDASRPRKKLLPTSTNIVHSQETTQIDKPEGRKSSMQEIEATRMTTSREETELKSYALTAGKFTLSFDSSTGPQDYHV